MILGLPGSLPWPLGALWLTSPRCPWLWLPLCSSGGLGSALPPGSFEKPLSPQSWGLFEAGTWSRIPRVLPRASHTSPDVGCLGGPEGRRAFPALLSAQLHHRRPLPESTLSYWIILNYGSHDLQEHMHGWHLCDTSPASFHLLTPPAVC